MDGAPLVSLETARLKAYSAAAISAPTDDFFTAISADASAVASFGTRPGLAMIAGGLPVTHEGVLLGGVGVAGAMTGAEDRAVAEAAAVVGRVAAEGHPRGACGAAAVLPACLAGRVRSLRGHGDHRVARTDLRPLFPAASSVGAAVGVLALLTVALSRLPAFTGTG